MANYERFVFLRNDVSFEYVAHYTQDYAVIHWDLFVLVVVFAEGGELRRTLQSLACGKARVLMKKPKVRKT